MDNNDQPHGELPNKVDPALEQKPDVPIGGAPQQVAPSMVEPQAPLVTPKRRRGIVLNVPIIIALLIVLAAVGFWAWHTTHKAKPATQPVASTATRPVQPQPTQPKVAGLQLDPQKNYGDKYASGLLPVGDGKYQSTGAKQGYIYACTGYAQNMANQAGGAGKRGPWFTANNTEYDVTKKIHVLGSVTWQPSFSNTVAGSIRTITTNDLPGHITGIFPIRATDPAYAYDRNPNAIMAQSFTYSLSADPTYNPIPTCESGQVGVMLDGVALFDGLDAGGRDAGAWEIQDGCDGHPQKDGIYHYHTLSSCIKDTSVQTVIGYALDGFPITGPQVGPGNVLTSADLDECHGIVSQVSIGGKLTTTYHYVMTQDYPYSVGCYHGTPITPPGQSNGVPTNAQKP